MPDEPTRRTLTIADLRLRAPVTETVSMPTTPVPIPPAPTPQPPPKADAKKAKKQLKAKKVKVPSVPTPPGEETEAQRGRRKRRQAARLRRRIIAAQGVLIELQQRYPAVFCMVRRPLAIGIHHAILADLGCNKILLSVALNRWTNEFPYLGALANGTHRFNLDGDPVAELTDEERANARERLKVERERLKVRDAERKRRKQQGNRSGEVAQAA